MKLDIEQADDVMSMRTPIVTDLELQKLVVSENVSVLTPSPASPSGHGGQLERT